MLIQNQFRILIHYDDNRIRSNAVFITHKLVANLAKLATSHPSLVFASLSTLVSLLLAVQDKPASASPEASPRINRPPLSPILALPEHHRLHAPDLHLAPLLPVGVAATAPVALMALYDLHRDVIDVQHATQWLLPFGCALMAFVTRRMIEGSQSEVRSRRVVSNADGLQLQSLERLKCATAVLRAR